MIEITYQLNFENEVFIGTGFQVPGKADNITRRGGDEFPIIPGETIKGIIKDMATKLCNAHNLPLTTSSTTLTPIERIFGKTGGVEGGFAFHDASYPRAYRELRKSKEVGISFDSAHYQPRTRNRIYPESRRSQEDHLFTFELARPKLAMEGFIVESKKHANLPPDIRKQDIAILLVATRCLTELGGWRRKGVGACRFLPLHDQKAYDEWCWIRPAIGWDWGKVVEDAFPSRKET